jgi:hypothetical protein
MHQYLGSLVDSPATVIGNETLAITSSFVLASREIQILVYPTLLRSIMEEHLPLERTLLICKMVSFATYDDK